MPDVRLGLSALPSLPSNVQRPAYDPADVTVGIVHLGLGAFHRAHQAIFTDDASNPDALSFSDGYKVVFLAFPLEAYGTASDKANLIQKVYGFFGP